MVDINHTIWTLEEARRKHGCSESLAHLLLEVFPKNEPVVDFGCGTGYYLKVLGNGGYQCVGIEGTPGIEAIAQFPGIIQQDLSKPLSVNLEAANVLSLEVGEHIAPAFEEIFIDNITKNCLHKMVLSWAIPGQVGHGHFNCQTNQNIIDKISKRGFQFNAVQTEYIRATYDSTSFGWFKNTLMIFDKP